MVERLGSPWIPAILPSVTLSDEAQFQIRRGERMLREREERRRHLREVASRVAAMLHAEFGAQHVWLFGSVIRPWFHEESDIDLAAEGIAEERRGSAWDRALELADTAVDLVFLEEAAPLLRERILADGEALV
jgi:predicted nucleotidyltransferase